jgi:hypothetical protein
MSDQAMPENVTGAEQIGLSAREAKASVQPRDAGNWAAKVERLAVEQRDGVRGTNVAGRRLTGPVQGFGKMWEKSYSLNAGRVTTPQDAIATWKAHFPEFWPKGNRFAGALAGISPGDVALLDLAIGGGVKLSTGVFVLYADQESFTLMTPQGHMFAGWITFSAERTGEAAPGPVTEERGLRPAGGSGGSAPRASGATTIRAHVLMRANDPLYEVGMTFGGHAKEDQFWAQTLTALGTRLGVPDPRVETRSTCVDSHRQWRNAKNIWHNAMLRSTLQTLAAPLHRRSRPAA